MSPKTVRIHITTIRILKAGEAR